MKDAPVQSHVLVLSSQDDLMIKIDRQIDDQQKCMWRKLGNESFGSGNW